MSKKQSIQTIRTADLSSFSYSDPEGIAVIMPCTDTEQGQKTAEILHRRAGMDCKIIIVHDINRQGFIKTLNDTAARITAKYIVYLAQDAYPGRGWLKCAYDTLERTGKGLLAFNDGKWQGLIASFGMVRTSWVKTLYGGPILYPGYKSHAADNELAVIARAQDMHEYNSECTLIEYDPEKALLPLWGPLQNANDKVLFRNRFKSGFDGLVSQEHLKKLSAEYKINMSSSLTSDTCPLFSSSTGVSIIILTKDAGHHLNNLLSSFFSTNTYAPIEVIVIDHASADNTSQVVTNYISKGFIRYIKRDQNYSFAASCNFGASKAKYPYLFFLNNDIIYNSDILPMAVEILESRQDIGAVGVRLDDVSQLSVNSYQLIGSDPPINDLPGETFTQCNTQSVLHSRITTEIPKEFPKGFHQGEQITDNSAELNIQHLGIEFRWNEKRGYYQPEQIRAKKLADGSYQLIDSASSQLTNNNSQITDLSQLTNNNEYPAVTAAAMLVRHSDFQNLGGFNSQGKIPGLKVEILAINDFEKQSTFFNELSTLLKRDDKLSLSLAKSEQQLSKSIKDLSSIHNNRLISIVMPTHNRADIIGQAIQSVFDQTYTNWELIICDDGSTDDTDSLIKGFSDNRINYIKTNKVGAAEARNICLRNAKGEYIAYLDSDNIWHPRHLEVLSLHMSRYPGWFAAYSKYIDVEFKNSFYELKKANAIPFNFEQLMQKPFIDLNCLMHRRELYDCFGGFELKLKRRQDYQLMLKYSFLRDFYYCDVFTMLYRRNSKWNQITQTMKHDFSCNELINQKLDQYFSAGLTCIGSKKKELRSSAGTSAATIFPKPTIWLKPSVETMMCN